MMQGDSKTSVRLALMGGAYGNVPALRACIDDAHASGCDTLAFLGDATGCCGHSDEVLELVRAHFSVVVAGNHEQQAAAGALTCGCGYASAEDERLSCQAHAFAMQSLSAEHRRWVGEWPGHEVVRTPAGAVLLCHGSPDQTNEFLYESQVSEARLLEWLKAHGAAAMVCTHTGLPWVRRLAGGGVAVNCGAVGKPDHDGDPAVHYAQLTLRPGAAARVEIRRVVYDHHRWADQLRREGVEPMFTGPLRTGVWTTGVASLPEAERACQRRPMGRGA